MSEVARRSWRGLDSDSGWVERRRRGPAAAPAAPAAPLPTPLWSDCSGFVSRAFEDRRPATAAPAVAARAPPPPPSPSQSPPQREAGGWVCLIGVPRDACLSVRAYCESCFGPTRAMLVAAPPRASMAGAGELQECYVNFVRAEDAAQAVRVGEVHVCVERGAAATLAAERLARVYPEAAGVPARTLTQESSPPPGREGLHRSRSTRAEEGVRRGVVDSLTGPLWVSVRVTWSCAQSALPTLGAEGQATPAATAAAEEPRRRTHTAAVEAVSAAAANMSALDILFASAARTSVWLALPRVLLLLLWTAKNVLARLLWGVGWSRASSVTAAGPSSAPARETGADGGVQDMSIDSSSSTTTTTTNPSSAAAPHTHGGEGDELTRLLRSPTRAHRRSRRTAAHGGVGSSSNEGDSTLSTRTADALARVWRGLQWLCDADGGGMTHPSFAPTHVLANGFYALLGDFAPSPAEVDLVLWSWLWMRSPFVQRNYAALRRRLRRLARAVAVEDDTAVGVFGGLDGGFGGFKSWLGADGRESDGASADYRVLDDEHYDTRARGAGEVRPSALRVLIAWRPAMWVQRYEVVSVLGLLLLVVQLMRGYE